MIWVKTSKVVGIDSQREPIREDLTIKLTINDWYNWIKYVTMHGYKAVEVVKVDDNGKELDASQYQAQLDAVLKPVKEVKVDMKAELEAQKLANAELLKRLEALENRGDKDERRELMDMAKELGLSFAKNIKTDDLKSLIENSK